MKHTNILTESIFMGISQAWQNVQFMGIGERKALIKKVINLSSTTCGFVDYYAKYHLAQIIHHSEPYFNITGKQTKVKEFDKLGWYAESGKDMAAQSMYELDFNKVMGK